MEQKECGFFDYFNSFQQWLEEDNPTDKAVVLYMKLFCMMNRRGWQGWAKVDTKKLILLANATNKVTAYRARDELVRAGLIEYKPGKKGKASEYHFLCKKNCKELGTKSFTDSFAETEYCKESDTESFTDSFTESFTETEKEREKRKKEAKKEIKREKEISLKTKTKDKDIIIPPNPPQRVDDDDDERREQEKRFETFWARYPRKTHMAGARDAWNQLKPDAALFEQILQAVERGRSSQKWNEQDGRFIPGPDRWLTEKRWYDEPTSQPTAQSTTEISKEAAEWLKDEL